MKTIAIFILCLFFGATLTAPLLSASRFAKEGSQTCLVPGDYATIQAAVNDQVCADIRLSSGMFTENVTINRTVSIQGQGTANTVVNGGGIGDVFSITIGEGIIQSVAISVTISGLQITNGHSGISTVTDFADSIFIYLTNCLIKGNENNGIHNSIRGLFEVDVLGCTVSDNSGPGIANYHHFSDGTSVLKVSYSTINSNSGVGIYDDSCFRGYCDSSVLLSHSIVGGNLGGGIYAGSGPRKSFDINNSTISGNSAVLGGGIKSCGSLSLRNSTVSNNSADMGGGIYIDGYGAGTPYGCQGNVWAVNTIVANSAKGGDCVLFEGEGGFWPTTFTDGGYNIVEDGTCISAATSSSGDPLLGPLDDNGGPTFTHALLPGSPAMDTGENEVCLATDQRGYPRPLDGDKNGTAVCDIGAFEFDNFDYFLVLPIVTR